MSADGQPVEDRYLEWDGAYVLGALGPVERLEFEGHLEGCARCRTAVSELAGMPGLLAQVSPEDAARLSGVPPVEEPPETLVPAVLAPVRQVRHRLRRTLVGVAAALVLLGGGVVGGRLLDVLAPDGQQRIAFQPVESRGITAVVDLVPAAAGTEVQVECQYAAAVPGESYSVVVEDRGGDRHEVKKWPVSPGKVMRPSLHTALSASQIGAVEIRETATDVLVLRAPVR